MMDSNVLNSLNVFQSIQQGSKDDPMVPKLPMVTRVKNDGFVIGNIDMLGGVMLLNGGIFCWDVSTHKQLTPDTLAVLKLISDPPEILIIGTGKSMYPISPSLQQMLSKLGIQHEVMNSKQACSTYNILVEEERRVAAALIPNTPVSARQLNLPKDR
ncbi:hypothetical protein MP228_005408 [Amoeboaphelidium protococcarum]|nr:hypothetical protein MP228_005408 [Amoeboaphelidium protococcarum]